MNKLEMLQLKLEHDRDHLISEVTRHASQLEEQAAMIRRHLARGDLKSLADYCNPHAPSLGARLRTTVDMLEMLK